VLRAHEKRGLLCRLQVLDWPKFSSSHSCQRVPLYLTNGKGENNRTDMRLDRLICNNSGVNFLDSISFIALPKSSSDHHPLLLAFEKDQHHHPSSFKFLKCGLIIQCAKRFGSTSWFGSNYLINFEKKLNQTYWVKFDWFEFYF